MAKSCITSGPLRVVASASMAVRLAPSVHGQMMSVHQVSPIAAIAVAMSGLPVPPLIAVIAAVSPGGVISPA